MHTLRDDLTLVIPAHGRLELTHRLLESLQRAKPEFLIILLDDATPKPLIPDASAFPHLRLIVHRNSQRVGPAACRNLGIWRAKTRFIAFTDNDVSVMPDWPRPLFRHLCDAPADVAGVGGRVIDDGRSLVGKYATLFRLLDPHNHNGRTMYLVTANCLFRRECLIEQGGFKESFFVPGGEDPELSFRLLRAGYRLEYEPSAVVVHHYDRSVRKFFSLFVRYGRGCRKAMDSLAVSTKGLPQTLA